MLNNMKHLTKDNMPIYIKIIENWLPIVEFNIILNNNISTDKKENHINNTNSNSNNGKIEEKAMNNNEPETKK